MSTIAQIEEAVFALPNDEFLTLLDRMQRRVGLVDSEDIEYESPELEAELLKAVDGPRLPFDAAFLDSIRQSWPSKREKNLV